MSKQIDFQQAPYFDHEKLDVYQVALEYVAHIDSILKNFPRGKAYLCDQLQRASTSIVLNIAEGAGEYSMNEKIRFYRMAKRSATECVGIIDVCRRLGLIQATEYQDLRKMLARIVAMLIKLATKSNSGTSRWSGS